MNETGFFPYIIQTEEMLIGHLINNVFSSLQLSGSSRGRGQLQQHLNAWPVARREHRGQGACSQPARGGGKGPSEAERGRGQDILRRSRGNNHTAVRGEEKAALLSGGARRPRTGALGLGDASSSSLDRTRAAGSPRAGSSPSRLMSCSAVNVWSRWAQPSSRLSGDYS